MTSSRLIEFLDKKDGAVEILATIDVNGTRYGELDDVVGVSHDTVALRLAEAEELGLVQREAVAGERGTTHKWALAGKGARIRRILESTGVVQHYQLIQMYRRKVEEAKPDALEQVRELEQRDDFDDKIANEKALHNWKVAIERQEPDEDE